MKTTAILIAGLFAALGESSAQTVPTLQLGKATGTASEEFTRIAAAQELSPGRLLVGDERDRKLVLVDFAAGTSRPIGRTGAGPGEFRSLGALLPRIRGGGVFLVDFVQRRLLPVNMDATLGDPVPFPAASLLFQSTDSVGRLYANTMLFRDRVLSDSMRIVRWDPATNAVDTLLTFNAGRSGMIIHPGEKRRVWYATTSWAPLSDGSIAMIDAATYKLKRWTNGETRDVAALPFDSRPVTVEDREAFNRMEASAKPMMMGQGGAQPAAAPPRPESSFPATYPAFGPDTPLWRAPDGNFWIERLGTPRDSTALMEIASTAGKLIARLRLPPRSHVIALGKDAVYLVERDSDDVERVRRYSYPR
jgi:hypothetical protein